jgi:alkanesulfonate monooxygenase SsuD/methylene tetrahydromethanopterin reductase-like flavin-dependent oxidoreductase (luciferase family)
VFPVVKVGLTLPSFQSDPERVLAIARAVEDAGLDGVFAFDHLFRQRGDATDAERRPALELLTMTAAVAAATSDIAVGTLVARSTLRPPGMLRAALDTLARIAPGRIIAGLGAGDDESVAEDTAFGVLPGDPSPTGSPAPDLGAYRLARLEATVGATAGREYPVWVAGRSPAAMRIATRADGWNLWGGTPAAFAAAAERVREELRAAGRPDAAGSSPAGLPAAGSSAAGEGRDGRNSSPFALTWGGLAVLGENADAAAEKWDRLGGGRTGLVRGTAADAAEQIAAYAAAGAAWVILGPIDSSNPSNAAVLGEAVEILRRAG